MVFSFYIIFICNLNISNQKELKDSYLKSKFKNNLFLLSYIKLQFIRFARKQIHKSFNSFHLLYIGVVRYEPNYFSHFFFLSTIASITAIAVIFTISRTELSISVKWIGLFNPICIGPITSVSLMV